MLEQTLVPNVTYERVRGRQRTPACDCFGHLGSWRNYLYWNVALEE